jgi:hypothetical protein
MRNKIQFWLERRRIERRAINENPILGLKQWMKRLAIGVGAVIIALALAIMQQYMVAHDRQVDEEAEDHRIEEERVQRSIEACFNYNEDQTNDRDTIIELVPQLAINFFEVPPEEADALLSTGGGRAFTAFVANRNPYRQCSRDCVIRHTTPGAQRCGIAIDAQGTPAPNSDNT